jgi:tRNA dimethylallyltransferase
VVSPDEEYSVARYIEAARECVQEIRRRGREVLFVGGTPLYLKGLLRGIFDGPPADGPFRQGLQQWAQREPPGALHQRLAEVDPAAASRLHPNDERRLIRALEVFEKTGRPISELQQQFDVGLKADQCRVFVLDWSRDELCQRIDRRVETMFAAGLVDEVRALMAKNCPLSKTASQGVGYREVIDHLDGKHDLEATIELVKTHTRRFAKRQGTWFRALSECRFVPVSEPFDGAKIAEWIAAMCMTQ